MDDCVTKKKRQTPMNKKGNDTKISSRFNENYNMHNLFCLFFITMHKYQLWGES